MTLRCPLMAMTFALAAGTSLAQPAAAPSRGQALYELHCIGCHTTQMHWRANRRATDWASLRAQVRLWQGNNQLNWSDDDIDEVARFLNERFYRFKRPERPVAVLPPAPATR